MQNLEENYTFNKVTCNMKWEKNNGGITLEEKDILILA